MVITDGVLVEEGIAAVMEVAMEADTIMGLVLRQ